MKLMTEGGSQGGSVQSSPWVSLGGALDGWKEGVDAPNVHLDRRLVCGADALCILRVIVQVEAPLLGSQGSVSGAVLAALRGWIGSYMSAGTSVGYDMCAARALQWGISREKQYSNRNLSSGEERGRRGQELPGGGFFCYLECDPH